MRVHMFVIVVVAVALTGACSGGSGKGSVGTGTTTSRASTSSTSFSQGSLSTSSTAPAAARSETPELIAINSIAGTRLTAPVWYLANAGATPTSYSALTAQTTSTIVANDGRYAAVRRAQDAVNPAGVDIIDVKTGREVDHLDIDEPRVSEIVWSPDDQAVLVQGVSAVYLHKIGGATASGALATFNLATKAAFASHAGVVSAFTDGALLVVDDKAGHFTTIGSSSVVAQLFSDGEPRAVYVVHNPRAAATGQGSYRVVPGKSSQSLKVDFPGSGGKRLACGRFIVWERASFSASRLKLYDVTNDSEIDVGPGTKFSHFNFPCPILSPDGKNLAFQFDDGVYVVGLATAQRTRVAREGAPIAWSSDSQSLAVVGNGVFVVRADGSGGKKANVTPSTHSSRIACRVGDSGLALFSTDTGLALFDVGANSARSMPLDGSSALDPACAISADGQWLLSGALLVDVRAARPRGSPFPESRDCRASPSSAGTDRRPLRTLSSARVDP